MKGKCSRAWLQLQLLATTAAALITGSSSEPRQPTVTVGSSSLGVTTCPFRTANYINHGLPQQCLRTSRVVSAAAAAAHAVNATGRLEVSDDTPRSASSPSLSIEEVGLATTTSIDLGRKFERPITPPSEDVPPPTEDAETPIDTANFLSFEEWKEQNLAKAGQSAENFEERPPKEARRRPGSMSSALDALGVDDEIELNFEGETEEQGGEVKVKNEAKPSETVEPTKHVRSKDAGKTCKERFNYASFDCAATVHKTNPESKGASSILVENKDSYMLNKCGAKNKFIIVELCDDILVDTVVLANYEFFSSMFRTFKVSVSDRYPVKSAGWKELGLFEAKNSREIQAFLVENPLIWARYIRIEFLTHFGKEFYCPISLLRVHGTTMMEEFRHQEEQARGYNDESEDMEPEAIAEPIETNREKKAVHKAEESSQIIVEESSAPTREYAPPIQSTVSQPSESAGPALADPTEKRDHAASEASDIPVGSEHQEKDVKPSSSIGQSSPSPPTPSAQKEHGNSSPETDPTITSVPVSEKPHSKATTRSSRPSTNDSHHASKETHIPRNSSSTVPDPSRQPSAVSSTAPSPTTQESFFKTIHKRLQLLEANATLSLQYIEEQSKLMRDTFSKMEKRQFNKSASYLDQLNMTVFKELREFRTQYDQLWQSTVIALDTQRELSEREILAISARLTMLADEVVFQKRMTIAQSFLMIVIVCLIVFSKTQHLETGVIRTVFSGRSQEHLGLESPPTSPSPPRNRPKSGRGASHKRRLREYVHQRRDSSDLDIPPVATLKRNPIPAQFYRNISVDSIDDVIRLDDEDGSMVSPPLLPQLTQSSPATPSGLRSMKEREWAATASDGEYAASDSRASWRPTSPLSKVSGAEEESDEIDEEDEDEGERVPDTDRATPAEDRGGSPASIGGRHQDSDGVIDSYFL
ncbi:hypothetical protein TWF481_005307 [Arthrobotrys musiformis]|uniref:SUN domain-containing protein n=1 Tax=Arthrobotrys musiformis TaxID=47236 RepID=A0AAV9WDE4_9PEZI